MGNSTSVVQQIKEALAMGSGMSPLGGLAPEELGCVLLVLPERDDSGSLKDFLIQEGFAVEWETRASVALQSVAARHVGLVVLDVADPSLDGLEFLRMLRLTSSVPVLALTNASDRESRISALELGADGCIAAPWSSHELAARIRAVLRRSTAVVNEDQRRIQHSGVTLDRGSREVHVHGRKVELTTTEFDILDILMRSAGNPVSREAVIRKLYNRAATGFDRSVNVHVSNLRKKLESGRTLIKAVRGTGYQFCLSQASGAVLEPEIGPLPEEVFSAS